MARSEVPSVEVRDLELAIVASGNLYMELDF